MLSGGIARFNNIFNIRLVLTVGSTNAAGDCNFMSNYRFLVKFANAYGDGGGYLTVARTDIDGLSIACYASIVEEFKAIKAHDLNEATNCTYCNKSVNIWNKGNDTLQKAFVMGLAMHVAMDSFAHSSFYKTTTGSGITWKRIVHEPNNIADDVTFKSGRVQMAYAVAKNVVSRYNENRGSYHTCNDFYNTSTGAYTGLDYRITKIKTFAEAAGYTTTSVLSDFGKLQSQ